MPPFRRHSSFFSNLARYFMTVSISVTQCGIPPGDNPTGECDRLSVPNNTCQDVRTAGAPTTEIVVKRLALICIYFYFLFLFVCCCFCLLVCLFVLCWYFLLLVFWLLFFFGGGGGGWGGGGYTSYGVMAGTRNRLKGPP